MNPNLSPEKDIWELSKSDRRVNNWNAGAGFSKRAPASVSDGRERHLKLSSTYVGPRDVCQMHRTMSVDVYGQFYVIQEIRRFQGQEMLENLAMERNTFMAMML